MKYLRLDVDILMSDWGDEDWKARKKEDGVWEFKEFDMFRQGKLKIGFGKFFVQAKKIVKN